MKLAVPLLLTLVSILSVSGCCKKVSKTTNAAADSTTCTSACMKIIPSDSAPQITDKELEEGKYYGSLTQKKKGTPENWIHVLEGTRSATWCSPQTATSFGKGCDCDKY